MNPNDQQLLQELGCELSTTESSRSSQWRIISRGGRVLMLLKDGEEFPRALNLYAPQRGLAKATAEVLKRFKVCRRLLPLLSAEFSSVSPIARVEMDLGGQLLGILLGNPEQEYRRALALVKIADGKDSRVAKIGTNPAATQKVRQEISVLQELASLAPMPRGIPELSQVWKEDQFTGFAMPFFPNGSGRLELSEVLSLLESWFDSEDSVSLKDSSDWPAIVAALSGKKLQGCTGLRLQKSIRHGDFAPWNIGREDDGSLVAIDWETGKTGDIPGWDLVHFLWVRAELVGKSAPSELPEQILGLLKSNELIRDYLKKCGWFGDEYLLLKTYLLVYENFRTGTTTLLKCLELLKGDSVQN